jgi:hypothetical protein
MIRKLPCPSGRTALKPCTGWEANGGVTPLIGAVPMKAPDGGPGANVAAGSTARCRRVVLVGSAASAAGAAAARQAAAASVPRRMRDDMLGLPSRSGDGLGGDHAGRDTARGWRSGAGTVTAG